VESKFNRKLLEFDKYKHVYKQGFQHQLSATAALAGAKWSAETMYRASGAKTNVFIMQTSAAAKKWPTCSRSVDCFIRAFEKG
jgi:hypothetical protein